MPKQKQKLNISSLQDFVLNERNIETILRFTKQKPTVVKKKIKSLPPKKHTYIDFLVPKF